MSRPALGSTQSSIQWVPRALSKGVKPPGHEADHPPPSIKMLGICGAVLPFPNTSS